MCFIQPYQSKDGMIPEDISETVCAKLCFVGIDEFKELLVSQRCCLFSEGESWSFEKFVYLLFNYHNYNDHLQPEHIISYA